MEVQGDPAATFEQLSSRITLFKAGLAGWLIIFLTDLIVSFSLGFFFRDTRRSLSLATASVRILYTAVLGIALIRLFSILPMLADHGIDAEMAGRQVLSTLKSFETIWSIGLTIFGIHLLGLGYLSLLHARIPKVLGYLLLLAGLSYMLISILENFTGISEDVTSMIEKMLIAPMALSEIILAFWMIIRGGKR